MVRRKNTVPKCLNPKMPNAKYMSIYLLSMSQNPKLIQQSEIGELLSLSDERPFVEAQFGDVWSCC